MKTVVVDASAAFKWLFPESGSDVALALLDKAYGNAVRIIAPELLRAEIGNALWRSHVLLGQLPLTEVQDLWERFNGFPLSAYHHGDLVEDALAAACDYGRGLTVYDATYIACAMHNACGLVTADAAQAKAAREFLAADDVTLIG